MRCEGYYPHRDVSLLFPICMTHWCMMSIERWMQCGSILACFLLVGGLGSSETATTAAPYVIDLKGSSSLSSNSYQELRGFGLHEVVDRSSFIARHSSQRYTTMSLVQKGLGHSLQALVYLSAAQGTFPREDTQQEIRDLALSVCKYTPCKYP